MSTTATLPSLREDTARLVTIDEQIARLNDEKSLIQDRLRTLEYGNHDAGDWTVQVQHNRRLDAARIAERYPVAQYPHLYEPKISTAAVKEYFAPVELEQYQIEGAPKLVVK
jgi:hypothetical protein